jgi:hypothetical protein
MNKGHEHIVLLLLRVRCSTTIYTETTTADVSTTNTGLVAGPLLRS